MTKHQVRRACWLWLPTIAAGAGINAYSYTLTLTANGLTMLGMAVIAAGTLALAIDHDRTRS